MSYTNGTVTRNEKKFNPNVEVKQGNNFKCSHCGRLWPYAFKMRGKLFCTATCWMNYYPMTLTGDETRLDKIAADLAENRCSGRGSRKKS
jgi:hypothetical protein